MTTDYFAQQSRCVTAAALFLLTATCITSVAAQTPAQVRINKNMGELPIVLTSGPVANITGANGTSEVRVFAFTPEFVRVQTPDNKMHDVPVDEVESIRVTDGGWAVAPQRNSLEEIAGVLRSSMITGNKYGIFVNDDALRPIMRGEVLLADKKPDVVMPTPAPEKVVEPKPEPVVVASAPVAEPVAPPAPTPVIQPAVLPEAEPVAPAGIPQWVKFAVAGGAVAVTLLVVRSKA